MRMNIHIQKKYLKRFGKNGRGAGEGEKNLSSKGFFFLSCKICHFIPHTYYLLTTQLVSPLS